MNRHAMANSDPIVLQIIPRVPGSHHDGVGDYALNLAKALSTHHGITTLFAVAEDRGVSSKDGFEVVSIARLGSVNGRYDRVILHYVNYGYQNRGVPIGLLSTLRRLRGNFRGRFVTIFHELYASTSPWGSAFWLQPLQRHVARSISQLADVCFVTSGTALAQLRRLNPSVRAFVQPVVSNFGEPALSQTQIADRDPHCWVICGGTALVERSVQSFQKIVGRVPEFFSLRELFVIGGNDNAALHAALHAALRELPSVKSVYRPQVGAKEASQILSACSFGWLDYFHRSDAPTDALLKSSVFAAFCAHGVIPALPHRTSRLAVEADSLPGPFFIDRASTQLPAESERARVATEFYDWYHRRASLKHLARKIAEALGLAAQPDL